MSTTTSFIHIVGSRHLTEEDLTRIEFKSSIRSKQIIPRFEKYLTILIVERAWNIPSGRIIENIKTEFPEFNVFDSKEYENSVYMSSEMKKMTRCVKNVQINEKEITKELMFDLFYLWRQSKGAVKEFGPATTEHEYQIYKPDNLPDYIDRVYYIFDFLINKNVAIMFKKGCIFVAAKMGNSPQLEKELNLTLESRFHLYSIIIDDEDTFSEIFTGIGMFGNAELFSF